ncbi:SulP family inorganic anion transporter [Brevibacillus centrosporus]|uniref:Sulfate permease, SulP family n=2 Tax=Brevibacillus centrosporus TaxID=54910 RepID=A0A1I4AIW6_9BACL|nr:SulP family inorganic anion transporter [Brevibacillus centrosporus]MEC2128019.1 SulP family inorganic anion transporter [Brevibacillus centrosporus]GED30976.1 sodium-independent anion transporter [Brevibacillus centrosporus]SFK56422.1 sulfate permease, SulP family [Brevibacillus centrosporus]
MNIQQLKMDWFSNVRGDVLAGMTVALALIPEAIAFSIIAGVDPMVGLYASFCIAVTIAFAGGRPGMISAATGAMALLMVSLVKEHGLEYLLAATLLTGGIQFLLGMLKIGRFMTFVPHSVVIGFVNALAILIFLAQLPHFVEASWVMYAMVLGTLAIIYILPRFTKAVPPALVAIIVMTAITIFGGLDLRTVGDMGQITRSLPMFHIPVVPLNLETLLIILPYSFPLALVGILESLMTASILDEMTDTRSDKNREVKGQGIANLINGFFGGMAGCAMIGQSVINVKSGGRGRLSTLVAGVFLLFLIMVLGEIVQQIPMAALVGVMVMVSIGTFDWQSMKNLRKIPVSDSLVMLVTVAIVVATHDLAKGVIAGVVLSAVIFGWKMARLKSTEELNEDGIKVYVISGQLFFGTMTHFIEQFDYQADPEHIIINLSRSHIWDHSAVTAVSKVVAKYQQLGKHVSIEGLNAESRSLMERVGISAPSGH